jgi:hypothetical protein
VFISGGGWFGDPWDLAPDSPRYLAYDYLLVKHRWLTASGGLMYGILLAAVFRRQFVESFRIEAGREFWIRLLVCSALLVSAAILWAA